MRRLLWVVGLLAVAALLTWAVVFRLQANQAEEEARDPLAGLSFATVERRDLVEHERFDGVIGFAEPSVITARLPGTLTELAAEGEEVARGGVLFRVDQNPVTLLLGSIPAYRTFANGMEDGADVLQLEENLVALGFDSEGALEVDESFDADTRRAIEAWQASLGTDEAGTLPLGSVVFLPTTARVGGHLVEAGSEISGIPGGGGPALPVLSVSSTEREVVFRLPTDRQDLVKVGDEVTIELPDETQTVGRVVEVSRIVRQDPLNPSAAAYVEVRTQAVDPGATGVLDQAPVHVEVDRAAATDVNAVPVTALIALAEGGYAVEVVNGSETQLVGVEVGTFADAWVEVRGAVEAGMRVVVAN